MSAALTFYDSDGATPLAGNADTLDTIIGGATDTPKKFGAKSSGDAAWVNLRLTIAVVASNDGASQLRVAVDTATLSPPWGLTLGISAPGAGGIWATVGTYAVVVTAVKGSGETIASDEATFTIDDTTKLATPSWTAVPGANSYNVYLRSYPGGTYASPSFVGNTAGTSLSLDGTAAGAGAPPAANTTGGTSPGYGTPPALGLGPMSAGALAIGQWVFFWIGRTTSSAAGSFERFADIVGAEA